MYDPDFGDYVYISGTPLYSLIDYQQVKLELDRIIETQNINFSRQDVVTAVSYAQEATIAYLLSLQQETFLGCNVDELVAISQTLDPMDCIRITPEGYVIINVEGDIPEGSDAVAKWTVGICCGIAIIGSTALSIFVPAARPLSGAITGAAIDVFMQVVIENHTVENIDWRKVGVAAVSGAVMAWACPLAASGITSVATKQLGSEVLGKLCGYGMLTLTNSIASGATTYANACLDGEDTGWDTFLSGAAIGAVATVGAAALSEICSAAGPKVAHILSSTKAGQWINRVTGKASLWVSGHQIHLPNDGLESILAPKSVHQAAKLAIAEINGQTGAAGGAFRNLCNAGDGSTNKHEMPSFSASGDDKRGRLPAIKMEASDHRLTASWGASEEALQYQEAQRALCQQGKYMEALQMDIDDITSKFGTKYSDGLSQALEYAKSLGW